MSTERIDVLIVGGGVAGLATHLLCRQLGIESLVLEALPGFTIERGDVLHRRAIDLLERLGVELATAQQLSRFVLACDGDPCHEFELDACSIRYPALCTLMYQAAGRTGVEFGSRVVGLQRSASGHDVAVAEDRRYHARLVVAASGSTSALAERVAPSTHLRTHARFQSLIVEHDDSAPVMFGRRVDGVAWYDLRPTGPTIGVSLPNQQVRLGASRALDAQADDRLDVAEFLGDQVGCRVVHRQTYATRSGRQWRRRFDGGVLVGDVAAVFHPLGGQGISEALSAVEQLRNHLPRRSVPMTYDLRLFPAGVRNVANRVLGTAVDDHFPTVFRAARSRIGRSSFAGPVIAHAAALLGASIRDGVGR